MLKFLFSPKVLVAVLTISIFSCDDDEDVKPNLRTRINYSVLTPETSYKELFVDENGTTTADFSAGNARYKMFQSLNSFLSASIADNSHIDAAILQNMFANTGNPFTDAALNTSGVQLKDVVASSRPTAEAEAARARLEMLFEAIEEASHFATQTASKGQAGKLENRLVDAKGIELIQVIQKSLIGALQLDYIGNVLLDEGLSADNYSLVTEKPYTQLEHNWDEAYGLLTLNPIYLEGSTDLAKGTTEFGAGSYIWEYNKAHYADIYPAFLKGRAAIVNNDHATLQTQATFIRTEFEKALASAALGYLGKAQDDLNDADRAHHVGEGLGFIYSLRFATIHGADAAFSDAILDDLIGSPDGFWDIGPEKLNAAADAIRAKFGL